MSGEPDLDALAESFELRPDAPVLTLEGSLPQVEAGWRAGLRTSVLAWLVSKFGGGVHDARKRGLVEGLLAHLEREPARGDVVRLHVDLRSARLCAIVPGEAPDAWSGLVLPATEPAAHEWLRLGAQLGPVAVDVRVRSLVGKFGHEVSLRDEIGVELVGEGLPRALAVEPPGGLRTELVAHDLQPSRMRLRFRGRGAARLVKYTPEEKFDEFGYTPLDEFFDPAKREAPEYRYEHLEWLVHGDALAGHVDYALALTRAAG